MGELAALRGDDATARDLFRQVVDADPTSIRDRLLLADALLALDDPAGVIDLLAQVPDVDGVLVRRVLAARALGQNADATAAADALGRRVRLNLDLGLTAHAREEAMYFLGIADDPAMALVRAKVNWDLQHEIEDARLLLQAAQAEARVLPWRWWGSTLVSNWHRSASCWQRCRRFMYSEEAARCCGLAVWVLEWPVHGGWPYE